MYFQTVLKYVLILIFINLTLQITWAECSFHGAESFKTTNVPIDMGVIVVLPSDPVGKVIATKHFKTTAYRSPTALHMRCPLNDVLSIKAELTKNNIKNGFNSFDTNLAGIGIRISTRSTPKFAPFVLAGPYPYESYYAPPISVDVVDVSPINLAEIVEEIVVELVKTDSRVSTGYLDSGQYSRLYPVISDSNAWLTTYMNLGGSQIVMPQCQVLDPQGRNIQLPNVSIQSFKGMGSTAAETVFDVLVSCADTAVTAGNKSFFKLNITADYVREIKFPTIMQNIAGDASARGVGLELLFIGANREQKSVERGRRIEIMPVEAGSSQLIRIPFMIRYIQSGNSVSSGDVRSYVTFTFEYL